MINTPVKDIRRKCVDCCNGSSDEIRDCTGGEPRYADGRKLNPCSLYEFRMSKRPKGSRPLKAIRQKCLDCVGFEKMEIKKCRISTCFLWKYRSGHRIATLERSAVKADLVRQNLDRWGIVERI